MEIYFAGYDSPLGRIEVISSKYAVHALRFDAPEHKRSENLPAILSGCLTQLDQYFKGARRHFDVNTEQAGTDFQKLVWKKISEIPYGQTATYASVARGIGNEHTVRAVGNANGKNRIPIIVPCHRVIGTDDSLTGYAGGLWRKQWLLDHENRVANGILKIFAAEEGIAYRAEKKQT